MESLLIKHRANFFGDSHVSIYSRLDGCCASQIGGSPTAHNLIKDNSTSKARRLLFDAISRLDKEIDIIVMSFGEVDCRIHIYRQHIKTGKSFDELTDQTVINYGTVLNEIRNLGFKVCVLGIPPAGTQANVYKYDYYPDAPNRSKISKMFNDKMKAHCFDNGFPYIDVYSVATDENGFTQSKYRKDDIHLNKDIIPYVAGCFAELYEIDGSLVHQP